MVREYHFHRSFSAGQISRLMRCRTDLAQYRNGSFEIKNMINHVQGPVSTRPGFKFIADLSTLAGYPKDQPFATFSDGSPAVRLVPFIFSEDQSYILIFHQSYAGTKQVFIATQGGIVLSGGTPVTVSLGTFDIQTFDYAQYNDVLFIAQAGRQPTELIRNSHTSWVFQNQTITSMPSDWNGTDGYPERVAIFEQRVAYSCTAARPSTIWFSKSGYPYDFSTTSPPEVSDAVTYTISAGRKDKILWMVSQQQLMLGTLSSEHTISGAGDEPLSYQSVSAVRHTAIGSKSVKPIEAVDEMYFVGRLGRRTHRYAYTYEVEGYRSVDLNVLCPDIFPSNSPVKSWAYQADPNSTIWMCTEAGGLLSVMTHTEHGVVAWQQHDSSGNDLGTDIFVDLESIPGASDNTEVWAVTKREATFTGYGTLSYIYLEQLTDLTDSYGADDYYLHDCYVTSYSATGLPSLNVPHLSGRTVGVTLDGNVYSGYYIDPTDTIIDFTDTYWEDKLTDLPHQICVGIEYDVKITPTPPELENIQGGITGTEGRIVAAIVHFLRTAPGVEISIIDKDGNIISDPIPLRELTDTEHTEPTLINESIRVTAPSSIVNEVKMSLIQDTARPMTVLGITDIIEMRRG